MKKVLPLVFLFAVLIYILPLAALFFPSGKNEESGSGTAPAPSASAPPVTDGTQAPSAPQPGRMYNKLYASGFWKAEEGCRNAGIGKGA